MLMPQRGDIVECVAATVTGESANLKILVILHFISDIKTL